VIEPGWWNKPIGDFHAQIVKHCFDCGIPLRGKGDFATNGNLEQVSETHMNIYQLKNPKGKTIQVVYKRSELGGEVSAATQYLSHERS
jgi:hypothetical protein